MNSERSENTVSILYLNNADPTENGGGSRRIFDEAKRLSERGHQTTILAGRTNPSNPSNRYVEGVHVRSVKSIPDQIERFPLVYYYLARSLFPIVSIFPLVQLLATENYDVIVDNCSPHPSLGAFVGSLFSIPTIALVHEYHDKTALSKYNVIVGGIQLAAQHLLRGSWYDRVVVPREITRHQLREFGVKSPIHVIPNGIDFNQYDPASVNNETQNKSNNPPDIFVVSRLVHRKGIDFLIPAVERLVDDHPNLTVIIAGDGPERDQLETMVTQRNLDDTIIFTGYISEEQKIQLLNTASVFALPSRQEGFGIAVLEAMAMETPIVVNDLPILRTLVPRQGNAFVDVSNPNEFADALHHLIKSSKHTLNKTGSRNRCEAEKYRWKQIVGLVERLYRSVTNKKP